MFACKAPVWVTVARANVETPDIAVPGMPPKSLDVDAQGRCRFRHVQDKAAIKN
jgi:hypothetical protein